MFWPLWIRRARGSGGENSACASGEGDAPAVLVDQVVVMAAEENEVVEVGGSAVGPVVDGVGVQVPASCALREGAPSGLTMRQCPPLPDRHAATSARSASQAIAHTSDNPTAAARLAARTPRPPQEQSVGCSQLRRPRLKLVLHPFHRDLVRLRPEQLDRRPGHPHHHLLELGWSRPYELGVAPLQGTSTDGGCRPGRSARRRRPART